MTDEALWKNVLVLGAFPAVQTFLSALAALLPANPGEDEAAIAQETERGVLRHYFRGREFRYCALSFREDLSIEAQANTIADLSSHALVLVIESEHPSFDRLRALLENTWYYFPQPPLVVLLAREQTQNELDQREEQCRSLLVELNDQWENTSFFTLSSLPTPSEANDVFQQSVDTPYAPIATIVRMLDALDAATPNEPLDDWSIQQTSIPSRAIHCATCNTTIAWSVMEVDGPRRSSASFDRRLIKPGLFFISDGSVAPKNWIVLDVNPKIEAECRRSVSFIGCCGAVPSEANELNLTCTNGHLIGNEWSECAVEKRYELDPTRVRIS